MNLRGIERHHIIYTFASLIAAYIVYLLYELIKNSFFPDSFNWQFIIGFIIYFFMLIVLTKFLIFISFGLIHVMFAPMVLGDSYKTNHPIEESHFYLTSSSIITVFMVNEIFSMYHQPWILLPLLPGVFFITLFLNTKFDLIL
jgi:hypothetical protein